MVTVTRVSYSIWPFSLYSSYVPLSVSGLSFQ